MWNTTEENREIATNIELVTGQGSQISNWRSGYTYLSPGDSARRRWSLVFPGLPSLRGLNLFTMTTEDVTPAPYNQPPYPAAGDTAAAGCVVTGVAP